jgi:two-component system, sensor histidine kinase FlrB
VIACAEPTDNSNPEQPGLQSTAAFRSVLSDGIDLVSLFDALPAGVVVLDAGGGIDAANAQASTLLGGLERGEAWRDVVARMVRPRWDDGHDITLVSGRRVHIATRALPGRAGQLVLINDVSETRQLQDLLERYQRASALGQMTATLAHQLRTPVATALLQAGQLIGMVGREGRACDIATRLTGVLRRLDRLVDNLLAFARGGRLKLTPTGCQQLVDWLREDIGPMNSGDFSVQLPELAPAGEIAVNADALRSVLRNLADNAREICGTGGALTVSLASTAGRLQLRFQDNGPGVPAAELERIFEAFVSGRPNGTGLGLAVALTVVRAHGGELRCISEPAAGACFVVELPMIDSAALTTEAA